jgi:hypothetical protein
MEIENERIENQKQKNINLVQNIYLFLLSSNKRKSNSDFFETILE